MTSSRGPGGDRGASILELAIIAPVMALIVMGVLDLARGYQMQIRLENAAREGAAYAQLHPNRVEGCTGPDVRDRVVAEGDGLTSLGDFDIRVHDEDGNAIDGCGASSVEAGDQVGVEVSATLDVFTPMVERVVGSEIGITGAAEIVVQG